jgi:hypothetical protein
MNAKPQVIEQDTHEIRLWVFSGIALLSTVLPLSIVWLYFRDAAGSHTIGAWHGMKLVSSGEGRLIIIARMFRTGTFSLHYSNAAALAILLLVVWVAAWAIRRQHGRHRVRRGFPVGT